MAHRRRNEAGRLELDDPLLDNPEVDNEVAEAEAAAEADLPAVGPAGLEVLTQILQQLTQRTEAPAPQIRGEPTKIPKYSELISMREYLFMFRNVVTRRGWSDEEAAVQLCTYLTGPAQAAAFRLTDYGYADMERQLLRQFTMDPAEARTKLKNFKKSKNQTYRQAADEIRELVKASYAEEPAVTEAQKLREEIVSFRESVDWPELEVNLNDKSPATLADAVKIAEVFSGFFSKQKSLNKTVLRKVQPVTEEDEEVQPTGELTAQIQQLQEAVSQIQKFGEANKPAPVECYICGDHHYASGCPQRPARPAVTAPKKRKGGPYNHNQNQKGAPNRSNNKNQSQQSGNE